MKKNFDLFDIIVDSTEPSRPSKLDTSDIKDTQNIYSPIVEQREAERQQREVYAAHQVAIIKSGTLRSEITKGIQEGQDPHDLLLKAIECISLMTGDKLFYELNKDNIKNIYGIGLLEPVPLRLELDEVQQQLKMLTRPELQNELSDSRTRIECSIKAHEERANYIKSLLERERPQ